MKITVAGVGYVGISLAVLLAQKHEVTAITTTEKKAERLNQFMYTVMAYNAAMSVPSEQVLILRDGIQIPPKDIIEIKPLSIWRFN